MKHTLNRLFVFDGKQGFVDRFVPADWAPARFVQSLPLSKNETAFFAYCRFDYKCVTAFIDSPLDMLKMVVCLFLGNTGFNRYVFRRQSRTLSGFEQGHYLLPDGLPPLNRHERLERFFLHFFLSLVSFSLTER